MQGLIFKLASLSRGTNPKGKTKTTLYRSVAYEILHYIPFVMSMEARPYLCTYYALQCVVLQCVTLVLHPRHVLERLRQLLRLAARPRDPPLHRGEVQVELPSALGCGGRAQVAMQVPLAVVWRPCTR